MATTHTIGTTGRNYSTLQAWEDAVPATPTNGYIGECYNDSQFTAKIEIAGHTTSAANFITLTAATGQSFQDHASVRTNPLVYDQSKGVGCAANPSGAPLVFIDNDYCTITRMQFKRSGADGNAECLNVSAFDHNLVKDCIFQYSGAGGNARVIRSRNCVVVNCLIYDENGGTTAIGAMLTSFTQVATLVNCTIVRNSGLSAGSVAIDNTYNNGIVKNCAIFGYATMSSGSGTFANSGYNATDLGAAPGSNNQVSKTYANQFVSTTGDFALKTGSDCINHGNTDALAPNDITATARGATTAGDIGAWEFAAAAPANWGRMLGGELNRLVRRI